MADKKINADLILSTAVVIAQRRGWNKLEFRDIAKELDVPLMTVYAYFTTKQDMAMAWFQRADVNMLFESSDPELLSFSIPERLQKLIMAWIHHLMTHRQTSKDMILSTMMSLDPIKKIRLLRHLHHTVRWICEGAECDTRDLRQHIETSGLLTIFISTLLYWLHDDSKDAKATQNFLHKKLYKGKKTFQRFNQFYKPGKDLMMQIISHVPRWH
jgi:ubiquinone biosynthesis protein COQ9